MKLQKISFLIALFSIIFASCQKEFSLEGAGATGAGTWQFNDSAKLYTGIMDTAYIQTSGTTKILHLIGRTLNGQQIFNLNLYATDSLTIGTYKASLSQTDFQYYTIGKTLYDANSLIGEFVVSVTVLSNNTVTGTFSGLAKDSSGNTKSVTLGKFTSKVDLTKNKPGGGGGPGAATGMLGANAGSCTPTTISGTYTQGVPLTSSNTVSVDVNVATVGAYNITTTQVNGVSFSKSGTFTTTGLQTVVLIGTGTPVSSGPQTFPVTFGTSTCNFTITFGTGTPPSNTLVCSSIVVNGTYTQGNGLTAANTLQVQVNVGGAGAYTVSTNTANGISFSTTGTFTATGTQTVTLTGSGTPTNAINQNYTITIGTSTCSFSIAFTSQASTDYFPLTLNSNWRYGYVAGTTNDSLFDEVISYTRTISAKIYSTITEELYPVTGTPDDSLYYRKPGGDYYMYLDLALLGLDNSNGSGEYIFLKDNVPVNTTWQSPTFTNTYMGAPISLYIKMTLKAKAVPVTLASVYYSDVIKVTYEYFANGMSAFTEERWFAKGVGLIYDTDNSTFTQTLARYKIF